MLNENKHTVTDGVVIRETKRSIHSKAFSPKQVITSDNDFENVRILYYFPQRFLKEGGHIWNYYMKC